MNINYEEKNGDQIFRTKVSYIIVRCVGVLFQLNLYINVFIIIFCMWYLAFNVCFNSPSCEGSDGHC